MPRAVRPGRILILAAMALVATALAGCETMTPYQPDLPGQRVSGGYSDTKLGDGRFRISFAGNSLTSRDRVEGYLLYRAAELTLREGYDWFLLIDRITERDARTYVRPNPFYRPYDSSDHSFWRPHWRYSRGARWHDWHSAWGDPFWGDGIDMQTVERFEAHAEILLHRGAIPDEEERAFDARSLMAELAPWVQRPAIWP